MKGLITTKALIESAVAYTRMAVQAPMLGSIVAAPLINPDVFKFQEMGKYTAYRAITGANAVTYDPSKGWANNSNVGGAKWIQVTDTIDREISFSTDFMEEVNSILAGMSLSGTEILNASWEKYGVEVDQLTIAKLYSETKSKHVNTETGYKTDVANIIDTMFGISSEQLRKKIKAGQKRLTIMSDTAFKTLKAALVEKGSLYNYNTLRPVDLALKPVPSSVDPTNALGVNLQVYEFENHQISVVPDDMMRTHVTMLDGVTSGQTDGGVIPDTTTVGSANIQIMSIPRNAAAVSIRHITGMLTVPQRALGITGSFKLDISESMRSFADGISSIENIGIDQFGDRFGYRNRFRFDAVALEGYKDSIIAITDTPKA